MRKHIEVVLALVLAMPGLLAGEGQQSEEYRNSFALLGGVCDARIVDE